MNDLARHVRTRRPRRGITLVEVLLGLVITAMVAGAAMTMLWSVNRGTQSQESRRQVIMRRFLLSNRLSTVLRSSERVLAAGSDYVVLWLGDTNGDGKPSLAELQRLEWAADESRIWSYAAPATLPSADNTAYATTADFNAATIAVAGSAKFPGEVWGTGVEDFEVTLDDATPAEAKMVRFAMTLASDNATADLMVVNRMRQLEP